MSFDRIFLKIEEEFESYNEGKRFFFLIIVFNTIGRSYIFLDYLSSKRKAILESSWNLWLFKYWTSTRSCIFRRGQLFRKCRKIFRSLYIHGLIFIYTGSFLDGFRLQSSSLSLYPPPLPPETRIEQNKHPRNFRITCERRETKKKD